MSSSAPTVKFTDQGSKVVMDNGTVKVTISKPAGLVTAISYGGIDNLLSTDEDETSRGVHNAIARHGIHGLYSLFVFDIPASKLKSGDNTIYLTQRINSNAFNGVMYDYLRLEAPPS